MKYVWQGIVLLAAIYLITILVTDSLTYEAMHYMETHQ